MRTAIVVPFHNHISTLYRCISSVFNNTDKDIYRLFLLDDNSTLPNSILARKLYYSFYKDVTGIISFDSRNGYAGVVKKFLDLGKIDYHYDNVCILDSDTVVSNDWLDELHQCLRINRIIGPVLSAATTDQQLIIYDDDDVPIDHKQLSNNEIEQISSNLKSKSSKYRRVVPSLLDDTCLLIPEVYIYNLINSHGDVFDLVNDRININLFAEENDIKTYYCPHVYVWHHGHKTKGN